MVPFITNLMTDITSDYTDEVYLVILYYDLLFLFVLLLVLLMSKCLVMPNYVILVLI